MIEATKTGLGVVTALGIEAKHKAPTLALCRALLAAGHADGPMTVRDTDGRALLTVPSIAAAAGLAVEENAGGGPRFVKFRPFERDNIDATGVGVTSGSRESDLAGGDEGGGN
jgi:hypothetical protein